MANETDGGRDAPTCKLYHGPGIASDSFDSPSQPADQLLAAGAAVNSPSVLLVDAKLVDRIGDARAVPDHVVIVATDEAAQAELGRRADVSLAGIADAAARRAIVHAACQTAVARMAVSQSDAEFQE